jgi:hypothetical protein
MATYTAPVEAYLLVVCRPSRLWYTLPEENNWIAVAEIAQIDVKMLVAFCHLGVESHLQN